MKCTRCGEELRIVPEQVGVDSRQMPVYHRIGRCEKCNLKWDLDTFQSSNSQTNVSKKKESVCGIIGLILAFLSCNPLLAVISIILCIIAICSKKKQSLCGKAGIVISVFIIIMNFVVSSDSAKEQDVAEKSNVKTTTSVVVTPAPTQMPRYSEEILFRDIPWGMSYVEVDEMLGEIGLWGLSGESYRTFSVDEVVLGDYKGLDFEYSDINIIGNSTNGELEVAGYTTTDTSLYFAYIPVDGILTKEDKDSALYGAQYVFEPKNLEQMSVDLISKLKNIYGEPGKTTKDTDIYGNEYTYTYWYGQNETELVLRVLDTTNGVTELYEDEIVISYVWRKGDEMLQTASDILKAAAEEKEAESYGNGEISGL